MDENVANTGCVRSPAVPGQAFGEDGARIGAIECYRASLAIRTKLLKGAIECYRALSPGEQSIDGAIE